MSNISKTLPPGYRSVQDFLLRRHNYQAGLTSSELKEVDLFNDHIEYAKEPCPFKEPEETPKTTPPKSTRYYYERSSNSMLYLSDLPPPSNINFYSLQ